MRSVLYLILLIYENSQIFCGTSLRTLNYPEDDFASSLCQLTKNIISLENDTSDVLLSQID